MEEGTGEVGTGEKKVKGKEEARYGAAVVYGPGEEELPPGG